MICLSLGRKLCAAAGLQKIAADLKCQGKLVSRLIMGITGVIEWIMEVRDILTRLALQVILAPRQHAWCEQ